MALDAVSLGLAYFANGQLCWPAGGHGWRQGKHDDSQSLANPSSGRSQQAQPQTSHRSQITDEQTMQNIHVTPGWTPG